MSNRITGEIWSMFVTPLSTVCMANSTTASSEVKCSNIPMTSSLRHPRWGLTFWTNFRVVRSHTEQLFCHHLKSYFGKELVWDTLQRIGIWHFQNFWGNVNSRISRGHHQNWEHHQNQAPDRAQSRLIGPDPIWSGAITIDWAQSWLIGFGQVWSGASPKSGLESGLMEIAKIMSPHHRQGTPLGQHEKRKHNCSFHH
jgi:hypothetical protein